MYITFILFLIGLPDKQLYPSVSAVYGNTEVSMVYLGPPLDGWHLKWKILGQDGTPLFHISFVECLEKCLKWMKLIYGAFKEA